MIIKRLLIAGIIALLTSINSIGQGTLIDLTSNCRKGHNDLVLSIVDTQLIENVWIIIAKAKYKGDTVGFRFKIKNGINPGLVEGEIDNTSWALKSAEISSIGRESDNFVKAFSEIYSMQTEEPFTSDPIVFTCFSLNTEKAILEEGFFQFKLYFDDTNRSGLYAEVFFNTNIPKGIVEFPDKDPIHIVDFMKAMIR